MVLGRKVQPILEKEKSMTCTTDTGSDRVQSSQKPPYVKVPRPAEIISGQDEVFASAVERRVTYWLSELRLQRADQFSVGTVHLDVLWLSAVDKEAIEHFKKGDWFVKCEPDFSRFPIIRNKLVFIAGAAPSTCRDTPSRSRHYP